MRDQQALRQLTVFINLAAQDPGRLKVHQRDELLHGAQTHKDEWKGHARKWRSLIKGTEHHEISLLEMGENSKESQIFDLENKLCYIQQERDVGCRMVRSLQVALYSSIKWALVAMSRFS